jgi:RNA polymerase sigma-70 factor, ECF subfamily
MQVPLLDTLHTDRKRGGTVAGHFAVTATVSGSHTGVGIRKCSAEPTNARPGLAQQKAAVCAPSFLELYETYLDFVWSMTRHLGVERSEMDDIVQEIFFIIHRRLHTIEQPESLRSWIYSIVRRVVSGYHRTKRTRLIETGTARVEPDALECEWFTPQRMAEQSEQARLLLTLLEKLDASKREVFVLAELEEMTAPEIAAAVKVPLNTVYSRLRAARQELELALERQCARTHKQRRPCPN